MGIDYQQQQINLTLAQDSADVKTKLLVHGEALNAMEQVITGLLERLVAAEILTPGDELITEFRKTVEELHSQGWHRRRPLPSAKAIKCPGCNAMLRNVTGAPGERCDWCGHEFG